MDINALLEKLIVSRNFKEYAFVYNTHPSPTPYQKLIILLHLLTTNRTEYYKILQTITVDETLTQEINFITELDLLINTHNTKKIRSIQVGEEIRYFLDIIIGKMVHKQEVEAKREESDEYFSNIINSCVALTRN